MAFTVYEEKKIMETVQKAEEYLAWADKGVKSLLESSNEAEKARATRNAMENFGIHNPQRFKSCEHCGGNFDYAKIWAEEHPMEVAFELLILYINNCKILLGKR